MKGWHCSVGQQSVRPAINALVSTSWYYECVQMPRTLGGLIVALSVHLSDRLRRRSVGTSAARWQTAHSHSAVHYQMHTWTKIVMHRRIHTWHWSKSNGHNWLVGEKRKTTEVGYWEVDCSACVGSSFSNVGICKGLGLIPAAKWNVSLLLFNQHSCHFHTSCSHCANSKHSSQPRPQRRSLPSGRWSEGRERSPAEDLSFHGFKPNLQSCCCLIFMWLWNIKPDCHWQLS